MWCKVGSAVFIIIAIIMAILACVGLPESLMRLLMLAAKFFDVMLPILGVGALMKYLFTKGKCGCNCSCCNSSASDKGGVCCK